MRTLTLLCLLTGCWLAAGSRPLGGETDKGKEESRIAALIQQLGDDTFARREEASKELEALGERAVPALRRAAADHGDLEVRRRSQRLISLVQDKLDRTDVKSTPPPKGAIVLFDGKSLDAWVGRDGRSDPTWLLKEGGVVEANRADIRTRRTFADAYKLHVEFRTPTTLPDPEIGNSGVYLHGNYEVQILDSYGTRDKGPRSKSCGSIFGQTAPRDNACKPPGVWQSFDIEFRPPRFKDSRRVEHPRVTVRHNGVLIHDDVQILVDGTGHLGLKGDQSSPAPVLFQYYRSPVQFRNVWLLPLPEPSR